MKNLHQLIDIIKKLRDKDSGNAWDVEQTHKSLAPHILDENHELLDSVMLGDTNGIKEELGDMLMLIIEMAQIAEDDGLFTLEDVAKSASDKLHNRLPHFFSDNKQQLSKKEIEQQWQKLKEKKQTQDERYAVANFLDSIPKSASSLLRVEKIQTYAKDNSFWWSDYNAVFDKIQEELQELKVELDANDKINAEDELGDVLMMIVTLAAETGISPEMALCRGANKLETRLRLVEKLLIEDLGKTFNDAQRTEREEKWVKAKNILKTS